VLFGHDSLSDDCCAHRVAIILDEAHLLNDSKSDSEGDNTYKQTLHCLARLPLAGAISIGTQVRLEQNAREAVAKMKNECKAFSFGSFPCLYGFGIVQLSGSSNCYTVRDCLCRCIKDYDSVDELFRNIVETDISGRARLTASLLGFYYKNYNKCYSTQQILLLARKEYSLWLESASVRSIQGELTNLFNTDNNSTCLSKHNYITALVELLLKVASKEVMASIGTVICTKRILLDTGYNKFETGYQVTGNSKVVSFEYEPDEPRLRYDLWRVLEEEIKMSDAQTKAMFVRLRDQSSSWLSPGSSDIV
jgi:hypothetical protein